MKIILSLLFITFVLSAAGQQKDIDLDSVVIPLKAWQEKQLADFQTQIRTLNEQVEFMVKGAINEYNETHAVKIDRAQIRNIQPRQGELMLYIERKKKP